MRKLWLASWPRSGNTFLRALLYHAFGLKSRSVYAEKRVFAPESATGRMCGFTADCSGQPYDVVKTHGTVEPVEPDDLVIHLYRNGYDACASFFEYLRHVGDPEINNLSDVIIMRNGWSDHYRAWCWGGTRSMALRYEHMADAMESVVGQLAVFLDLEPSAGRPPTIATMRHGLPWFFSRGPKRNGADSFSPQELDLFNDIHGPLMRELGYAIRSAATPTAIG